MKKIVLLSLLLLAVGAVHAAEKRVALVIGNGAYVNSPLRNPVNDAEDIASMLQRLGFEVIRKTNANRKTLRRSLREFREQLHQDTVGLFYFAGHGMQVEGRNYLIPVGADVASEDEIPDEAIDAASVLRKMKSANNVMNIVILDACRNNPFARSFRSGSRGLTRMDAPTGSIIAYATAPDSVAADGAGRNGVYTKHLLNSLATPGLSIEYMFKKVRNGVIDETGGNQTPWEESSLRGDFYFTPAAVEDQEVTPPVTHPKPIVVAGGMDIRDLLAECSGHLKANRLTSGTGGNAMECYKEVLSRKRGHPDALEGLHTIERTYAQWADKALKQGNQGKARQNIEKLKKVNADYPDLYDLEQRLAKSENPAPSPVVVSSTPSSTPPAVVPPTSRKSFEPEMIAVRGGCYQMGSPSSESGRDSDEKQHRVCVEDFSIGKYEVTQAEWQAVMGSNPSRFKGDRNPVEKVSWNDVQDYLRKLNAKTGKTYRLPTEAEWEYACRSGGKNQKYCGGHDVDRVTWYGSNSGGETRPTGGKQANGLGLHDMSGNVWEWTCSKYDNDYGGDESRCAAPQNGDECVTRGGSWGSKPEGARSASRYWYHPGNQTYGLGFRLSRTK